MSRKKVYGRHIGRPAVFGTNGFNATAEYKKRYGDSIAELSVEGFNQITSKIKVREFWGAKEIFKGLDNSVENKFIVRQAMGEVLIGLYSRKGKTVSENDRGDEFYLLDYMDPGEVKDFLREMHEIYEQFKYRENSKIPTLGYRAQIILDGQEDKSPEDRREQGSSEQAV